MRLPDLVLRVAIRRMLADAERSAREVSASSTYCSRARTSPRTCSVAAATASSSLGPGDPPNAQQTEAERARQRTRGLAGSARHLTKRQVASRRESDLTSANGMGTPSRKVRTQRVCVDIYTVRRLQRS